MSKIMAKSSHGKISNGFFVRSQNVNKKAPACIPQLQSKPNGEMRSTQRMHKSGVFRPWKYKAGQSHLSNSPQALNLWSAQQLDDQ
jgi:hypothetical protein